MVFYKNTKISVNYITEQANSSAHGVNRVSNELLIRLQKKIQFKIISNTLVTNNSIIRQLYTYFIFPIKVRLNIFKKSSITHITNQGFAHLSYFLPQEKLIITCHDLIPYIFNKNRNFWESFVLKLTFSGLKNASTIIAVSKSTKNDLVRYLNIPKEKIVVIYSSLNKKIRRFNYKKRVKIQKSFFPNKKIILYVGSYLPNKNLPMIFLAFKESIDKISDLKLVIVNEKNKLPFEYKKIVKELNIQKKVFFTGYLADQELVRLYNRADIFLYPSLYEGFGFPPLEAMACGCPVITSDISSLPEVVGDAAIFINPNNCNEIAEKIIMLLNNKKIRDKLIVKGLTQSHKFYHNNSTKVLDVYRDIETVQD